MSSRLIGVAILVAMIAAPLTPAASASTSPEPGWQAGPHFDASGVSLVTEKELGGSWHHGCPVPPRDLRALQVGYWGFDDARHTGVLVVNVAAIPAIRKAFAAIARAHFPIRQIEPVAAYGGSDNRSMNHDNTSAFNCRYAVANGPKTWSEHAYGEAVDINTRENPYKLDGKILPPSGAKYANRSKHRRGMIFAGGPVVHAFDAVDWGWGGRWTSSPDYQHFSVNGR
jgi:D-alanyl-D-alanine carboxypeptidase